MMGYENQGYEEGLLHTTIDQMSTISLHDEPSPSKFNSILDPPSYAEAVFQSFSTILQISVSDPRREPDQSIVSGGTSYFSYLITTSTNLPQFDGTEFNVRRRFRDVVALSDRLAERYRGFFIPLRPDKNVVGSQVMMHRNEFLEQRRAAMEKYLRRLVAHPVLRNSDELRAFWRRRIECNSSRQWRIRVRWRSRPRVGEICLGCSKS